MPVSKQNTLPPFRMILERIFLAGLVAYGLKTLYATRTSSIFTDPYFIPQDSLFDRGPDMAIAFFSLCAMWILLITLKHCDERQKKS